MNKQLEMRENVFKEFKTTLDNIITSDDRLIIAGVDDNRNFFYYFTEKALLVLGGRELAGIIGNVSFRINESKHVKLEVLLKDLEQMYISGGEYQSSYESFIRYFLFPNLTHDMNNVPPTYSDIIRNPNPPISFMNNSSPLVESLVENQKRRNQKLVILQEKKCLEIIKELLLELEPNDEAKLGLAIRVVKEESLLSKISDSFIENALREAAQELPEFKYIRLTKSIRRKEITSEHLEKDIDNLFKTFDTKNKI